ncbi:MMPL family transporter [Catenuloplanes sp. NPDC051500]|uniref:MMPL family transporter n=1 Tax=Catenuloplanes sp. NPDC051500 TaxID=3363959 RepID=UPI0037ACDFF2
MNALSLSRFESPGSESVRAADALRTQFHGGSPNLLLLVTARQGTVDDAPVAAAGRAVAADLASREQVAQVSSYWTAGDNPALRSTDGSKALIAAWLPGSATEVRTELAGLSASLTTSNDVISVAVGGQDEVFRQVAEQARQDFIRAEIVILPVVILLLFFVYRRWSAALLTLGVGVLAMLSTLALLRVLASVTEVSTFAANLTLVLGLGLGIDYSLFMIFRFREELARGKEIPQAVARTVETAGRTVLFSGITVAVSLSVLLAFPFPFLRSFAYAGVLVVLTSVLGAILVLPAALAWAGRRVVRKGFTTPPDETRGLWYRSAGAVMKRPVLLGGAALIVLLLLGAPFLGVRFGLPDERILPADASSRIVQQQIRHDVGIEASDAINVVAPSAGSTDISGYAARLSQIPGVSQVETAAGIFAQGRLSSPPTPESARFAAGGGTWLSVIPTTAALDADATGLVYAVRSADAPVDVIVGGFPADMTDFRDRLIDRLPVVAGLILVITFVILFLMSGSLLIPLKATILNVLSLSVMFGALVFVFQEGNGASWIGFTATGRMEPSIPILMFCVAYGLSMDYEVFMLSRIREEYERTGDTASAVAFGLQRSGPLVTAAAAIMAFTFAAYATGRVGFLQMLGISMALAILVDATIIRGVLMPAFMKLAGRANWWAPGPLRRLHDRIGIRETPPDLDEPAPVTTTPINRAPKPVPIAD